MIAGLGGKKGQQVKKLIKVGMQQTVKLGEVIRRNGKILVVVAVTAFGALCAHADTTAPDASTIVTTAQTTFNAVGALVAAAVGFFIIVKIVKWIRK